MGIGLKLRVSPQVCWEIYSNSLTLCSIIQLISRDENISTFPSSSYSVSSLRAFSPLLVVLLLRSFKANNKTKPKGLTDSQFIIYTLILKNSWSRVWQATTKLCVGSWERKEHRTVSWWRQPCRLVYFHKSTGKMIFTFEEQYSYLIKREAEDESM